MVTEKDSEGKIEREGKKLKKGPNYGGNTDTGKACKSHIYHYKAVNSVPEDLSAGR